MNNFNHELVEQFQANAGTIVEGMFKGAPTHPDWYHNVVANPDVTVEVGQDRFQANASTAEGTERDRLYDAQVQMMPSFGFAEYLRAGLRGLLESVAGLEILGEATNGSEVVQLAAQLQPDVVLMDLRLPGTNGIEATRRIHRESPHIGILAVTIFEDDTSVFPAIRAGARGYLLKDAEQSELLRAFDELTARERDILDLLARGYTNPEIAEQLGQPANPAPPT